VLTWLARRLVNGWGAVMQGQSVSD